MNSVHIIFTSNNVIPRTSTKLKYNCILIEFISIVVAKFDVQIDIQHSRLECLHYVSEASLRVWRILRQIDEGRIEGNFTWTERAFNCDIFRKKVYEIKQEDELKLTLIGKYMGEQGSKMFNSTKSDLVRVGYEIEDGLELEYDTGRLNRVIINNSRIEKLDIVSAVIYDNCIIKRGGSQSRHRDQENDVS